MTMDHLFKWLWKLNWTALFNTKMLANSLVVFLYPLNTFHMSPQPALATLAVTVIGRLAPMFCDHLELILYFLVLMLLDKEGFSLFNMSILTSSWLGNIHLKRVSAIPDHCDNTEHSASSLVSLTQTLVRGPRLPLVCGCCSQTPGCLGHRC